jgi:hypothetical protein
MMQRKKSDKAYMITPPMIDSTIPTIERIRVVIPAASTRKRNQKDTPNPTMISTTDMAFRRDATIFRPG